MIGPPSADQTRRLAKLLYRSLAISELRAPVLAETEPAFTAAVLAPRVKELVAEIAYAGLFVEGDGAAPVQTVPYLGQHFRADIAVTHHLTRLVAVEVKFLRGVSRQNSIATALGQALIYRHGGFAQTMVFLIDMEARVPLEAAGGALATASVPIIVRHRSASTLRPAVADVW